MNLQQVTVRDGFLKHAQSIFRKAASELPGTAEEIESALNSATGRKVHLQFLNPTSAIQRWLARAQMPDGAPWGLDNPDSLKPGKLEKLYEATGATARRRQDIARKIGIGGSGVAAGGLIGYGIGNGQGQQAEDKYLGHVGRKYVSTAPLWKRLELALNTVFRPKSTGDQIQKVLS